MIAASAAALVVATAVGTATAITLTIDVPRTYESLVEITYPLYSGTVSLYTVPPGKKLIITDIIIGNPQTGSPHVSAFVGASPACETVKTKLYAVVVPPNNTLPLSLTTGLFFGPGNVCFKTTQLVNLTIQGYLFQ
jgi:hypothetical protein